MLMAYVKAFAVGGLLCMIGQWLMMKTNWTPARILVGYVTVGVLLSALGIYGRLVAFAGCGATVPLTGFGHALCQQLLLHFRGVAFQRVKTDAPAADQAHHRKEEQCLPVCLDKCFHD